MRRNFQHLSLMIGLFAVTLTCLPAMAEPTDTSDWTPLVTKDLSNFTTKGNWSVDDDGVVSIIPREGEKGWQRYDAYLWFNGTYGDFELALDFKTNPRGNSGLYFRVQDRASATNTGLEVQILEGHKEAAEGKRLSHHDMGGIIRLQGATKYNLKPAGEWNTMITKAAGSKITVEINGEVVNELDLAGTNKKDHPETGSIGLQDHGLPLWFRNIRMKKQ